MNLLFFLTPKQDVLFIYEDFTLRQTLEKWSNQRFATIPVLKRNGEYLVVDMTVDLSALEVDGNRAVLLTPRLVMENDSIDLPSIGIYGRKRYYFYVRNGASMLTGADEKSYKASQKPDSVVYHHILPYRKWMSASVLSMHRSDYGCCNTLLAGQDGMLGRYTETEAFFPELVYVRPEAEAEKHRSLEGSAFIDFPVNKTVIYPDYRRNVAELGKIQATHGHDKEYTGCCDHSHIYL